MLTFLIPLLCFSPLLVESATSLPAQSVATQYALSTSTSLSWPTATMPTSSADSYIVDKWSLSKGRIQEGPSNLAFVDDPFPDSSTPGSSPISDNSSSPVLEVTYPAGTVSFSSDTTVIGGAQFYSLWNTTDGSAFNSMMVSYEVAFDSDYNWVLGGKLPGLRGGPDPNGCSGGNPSNGTTCFSTRLMWRANGAGEVYAYVPLENDLCAQKGIICNDDDFGTSIDRGSFAFNSGSWNRVTLLVLLNNPVDVDNGYISLYFNDVQVISQTGVQLRSSTAVTAGGLYFSTFFGGDNSTWATPATTHSYFRNFLLWGSSAASNLTDSSVSSATYMRMPFGWCWSVSVILLIGLTLGVV